VIALDNGGSSILNQTWTASNVISVTFDFGNGAHKTVFDPNGGDGFTVSGGSFVTNGSGLLTAVPSSWGDNSQVNVISTNSTQTPIAWILDGFNDVYFTSDTNFASFSVGLPNAGGLNWTIAGPTATTPEPSTVLGFLALGSLGVLTRKRKG
jgi:hypothetical protein